MRSEPEIMDILSGKLFVERIQPIMEREVGPRLSGKILGEFMRDMMRDLRLLKENGFLDDLINKDKEADI